MLAMHTYRSRVGGLRRVRPPDDPEVMAAERDLTWCLLAKYAEQAVDPKNPLTKEQIAYVVSILSGKSARRSGHAAA